MHFNESKISFNKIFVRQVGYLQRIDQLVQLFDNLFDDAVIAPRHNRHSRDRIILRRTDCKTVYVISLCGEQPGNSIEGAEFVLDEKRNCVLADLCSKRFRTIFSDHAHFCHPLVTVMSSSDSISSPSTLDSSSSGTSMISFHV